MFYTGFFFSGSFVMNLTWGKLRTLCSADESMTVNSSIWHLSETVPNRCMITQTHDSDQTGKCVSFLAHVYAVIKQNNQTRKRKVVFELLSSRFTQLCLLVTKPSIQRLEKVCESLGIDWLSALMSLNVTPSSSKLQ